VKARPATLDQPVAGTPAYCPVVWGNARRIFGQWGMHPLRRRWLGLWVGVAKAFKNSPNVLACVCFIKRIEPHD